jgi:hypothetical protein
MKFIYTKNQKAVKDLESLWKEYETAIVQGLFSITGFILTPPSECLISDESKSKPLTVKYRENPEDMLITLVHELIHNLFMQEEGRSEEFRTKWASYMEKYQDESWDTQKHILLHAIQLVLYRNIFPENVGRLINFETDTDYRRSWDVVSRDTAENIIALIK